MSCFRRYRIDLIYLLLGYLICGSGSALLVYSNLGADAFNVCAEGIARHTGLQVGTAGLIAQLTFFPTSFL